MDFTITFNNAPLRTKLIPTDERRNEKDRGDRRGSYHSRRGNGAVTGVPKEAIEGNTETQNGGNTYTMNESEGEKGGTEKRQ